MASAQAHHGAGETVQLDFGYPSSEPQSPSSPSKKRPSSKQAPSKAGRTDWVILTPSPGPGAYNPSIQPVTYASERAVFGTAYREQEEKRFMSALHAQGAPNAATPGPGAYRTADNRMLKVDKSSKFGTAPQRPEVPKESLGKPGPIYDLPPTLSGQTCGFGNPSPQPSAMRSRSGLPGSRGSAGSPLRDPRSLPSERFPIDHIDGPGPDAYPLIPADKMSQHSAPPRFTFGRASREAATRSQLTAAQLAADSTVSTATASPGPQYDLPPALEHRGALFPRGPAHYAPERGGNSMGPYMGKLHEDSLKGIESPGPGTYAAPTCLQPAGGAKFGPPQASRTPKPNEAMVPGPGAHNPNFGALSVCATASAFSMGPNLRTDFTAFAPLTPGPAAYDTPSPERASTKTAAPAFSMGLAPGGRSSYVARNTNPAPHEYGRPEDPRDASPVKKGYSFGLRERTKSSGTVVTNRYHGPLAAQEGMGLESPGPGCYDLPSPTGQAAGAPSTRFGTSGREHGSKVFISPMHAAAESYGTQSPGPGCYNVAESGGLGSPSRFAAKVAPKFGTSSRFNDKVTTK